MDPIQPDPIRLVVVQPSPFCNINCRYCYLPDRGDRRVIDDRTLAKIYERLFASAHLGPDVSVLWHAGEPLAVGTAFYERAFALLDRHNVNRVPVRHLFQTNGTLVTQEWCDLIKRHGVHVGASIDGPKRFHDANRVTRSGAGTFDRALDGIRLLQANGIPVYTISVLTGEALDHPDEFWDFFAEAGLTRVGFNVEEKSGANAASTVHGAGDAGRYRAFLERLHERRAADGRRVRVRELDDMDGHVRCATGEPRSALNRPLATLSFDVEGNISTFSPELVTTRHPLYGDFQFGNVFECGIDDILTGPHFQRVYGDIRRGVERCRATCPYFSVCGGGDPANKLGENGTFDSAETAHCRLTVQTVCDLVLDRVEAELEVAVA